MRTGDKTAAAKVAECPLTLPDEIALPSSWSEATNVVYVTDLYWYPYMDFRALNPYAQFTVPATLPKKPALPLSAWDRMPSNYMTVLCTSGRADEPPPEFRDPAATECCASCRLCVDNCPTGSLRLLAR